MLQTQSKAYIYLHTAVFLFGFTGILGDVISLQETMLVWHRMWMSALLMFLVVVLAGKFKLINSKEFRPIAFASFFIALHWVTFYGSIKYASVSVAMVCLSTITLFTAVLEPIILRKRFMPSELVLSFSVMLGVAVIAGSMEGQLTGVILGIAAAILSAVFTILNKSLISRYDSRLLSFYEIGIGFLILTVLLPMVNVVSPLTSLWPTPMDWLYLFLLSSFCTVLAFNLSLLSLRSLSPFTVNLVINLEPVYGILLAFVLLKEHKSLNWGFAAGAIIIVGSVLMHTIIKIKSGQLDKKSKLQQGA
ncbi:MAG: DMT family transporter [Flavobacteriales bacterium]